MISYSEKITIDTWVQVASDGEDYILQNKGDNKLLVKAGAQPTSADGSIELDGKGVITSTIMNGNIWVRALGETVTIAYAK